MQKVTNFLERYVQWVALGLGILWIGWVAYAYWVKDPVAVDINGMMVTPGQVEDVIYAEGKPVKTLEKALNNELKIPSIVPDTFNPSAGGPQYVKAFESQMSLDNGQIAEMPVIFPAVESSGIMLPKAPEVARIPASMPSIPPETIKDPKVVAGISIAEIPDKAVKLNPNDQAQRVIQVRDPLNPNNPNLIPVALVAKELTWITVNANVVMSNLHDAFDAANIPVEASATMFLRVRLIRQELQADGSWADEKVVSDLANLAAPKPAWPPKSSNEEILYLDWASKATPDIVRPVFYEVIRGNLWHTASMDEPIDPNRQAQAGVMETTFDPANPPKDREWTGAERKMVQDYKEQKRKEEAEARKSRMPAKPTARPSGSSGGGRSAPRLGGYAPPPRSEQPINPRQFPGGNQPYNRRRAPQGYGPPRFPAASQPTQGGVAPRDVYTPGELPNGKFDPAEFPKDVEIWAHDETTVPGHTYRYKLEVSFVNPLYQTVGMAANPADAKVFALSSESTWTAPITSPLKQRFFASNGGAAIAGVPKISFEYFWWDDGSWKFKSIGLQPGDAVPGTPWTVFDIRPAGSAGGENRALLVSNTGEIISRYYKSDMKDPAYIKLRDLVKGPATPPTGNPNLGGAPGVGATGSTAP